MKDMHLSSLWLRIVLALRRFNPVLAGALALALGAVAAILWLVAARAELGEDHAAARRLAATPPPLPGASAPAPPSADQNLAHFYASLGERRHVDRQLKTLFALAGKNGLDLRQGEYRSGQEREGRFLTYQVTLPVTGRYGAIWQFAFDALRALPHASLDDVAFRRDAIGSGTVEARLRLTLHLAASPGVPQ